MTFSKFLASVSAAALIAAPAMAQQDETLDRSGTPAEEVVDGDENTVINNEDRGVGDEELGNTRVGEFQADAEDSPAMDSPYQIGTVDSFDMELDGSMMVADSPWVGKTVTTADGIPVGSVSEVYSDGETATAKVMLDDSLGIDAEEFLVQMGADTPAADVELAQNEVEFVTEMRNIVGISPGAAEDG